MLSCQNNLMIFVKHVVEQLLMKLIWNFIDNIFSFGYPASFQASLNTFFFIEASRLYKNV